MKSKPICIIAICLMATVIIPLSCVGETEPQMGPHDQIRSDQGYNQDGNEDQSDCESAFESIRQFIEDAESDYAEGAEIIRQLQNGQAGKKGSNDYTMACVACSAKKATLEANQGDLVNYLAGVRRDGCAPGRVAQLESQAQSVRNLRLNCPR
jgi:hypothetical protein